jgi:hypothetical protein
VVPTLNDDNRLDEVVDGSKQLKQMRTTVDLLEETIQQWELELDHYRTTGSASPDTAVGTSMIVSEKPMQRHSRVGSTLSDTNSISSSSSSTSTNDDYLTTSGSSHNEGEGDDLLVLSKGKEWQVTLANGQWRIDTHINTLSDLDQLNQRHHQPFLYRMPSPFQGVQVNTPIIIDACDERSLFPVTAKLAREYLMRPGKPTLLIGNGQLFPPPRRLLDNPTYVIDKLVRMYFAHYNESLAVLYEPRYMAHYQQLANPLDCPVTMALCSMVCCGHDDHLFAAATDGDELFACQVNRRAMGEFFYRHSRAILEHIFDDPERRLETVMAINLLKRFLMNTLRISEMRKLEMIGYLICLDLISSPVDDSVERELGVRHYVYSVWCRVTLDFFMDSISWKSDMDFVAMGKLPGESDSTWRFLDVQNRFFQIFIHPSIGNVFRRVQNTMLGDKVELTMEMILQFDRVMKQWWQDLPSELRLCDDPYDFNTVMAMVYQTQDDVKLTILLFFLDLVGCFHSCLIKIETRAQDALTIDHDIMALIQEKSIKASLDFSEILVLIVNRIDTNVAYTQCK